MAGIFGQTQVGEMENPVQPLAPVVDETAVAAARAVGGLAKTGVSIFGDIQEARASKASRNVMASYQQKQLKFADAVEQGAISERVARSKWRKTYAEYISAYPELGKELMQVSKDLAATTGFAKEMLQQSEEEKNAAAQVRKASEAYWVLPGMTKDEQRMATDNFMRFEREGQALDRKMKMLDAEAKQVGLDQSKLSLIQAERRETSIKGLSSLAAAYVPKVQTDMSDIVSRWKSGQIDDKAAFMEIQARFNVAETAMRQVGKDAGGDYITNLMKPMMDVKDLTTQLVTGQIDNTTYENQVKLKTNMYKADFMKNPKAAKLVANSALFPNTDVMWLAQQAGLSLDFIAGNTTPDGKAGDPFPDTPERRKEVGGANALIRQNMDKLVNGTAINPEATDKEVETYVVKTLKGVDAYRNAVESPKEYAEVVGFLTSPEFGRYVAKKGGLPQEAAAKAKIVFQEQYNTTVETAIKGAFESKRLYIYNQFDPRAIRGENKQVPATELIEPYWNGSGLAFKLKDGVKRTVYSDTTLRDLNSKAASLANNLIRLDSHLSGNVNYKQSYDKLYESLFGVEQEKGKTGENE